MFNLPYIPTAENLIDKAFRRGSKDAKAVKSTRKPRRQRLQRAEEKRVATISKIIESDLKAIIRNFPSYEQLPKFYQELLDIRIDKNKYKKSLGAVQWCLTNIKDLEKDTISRIRKERDTGFAKEFSGRSASFVKRISNELDELIEIKRILLSFPTLKEEPTIVVAGYPNAGKSTFVKTLTGSNVKIASYPFTTQDILIGHKRLKYEEYQIIDSPGLLDRPMEKRNWIELQAILAIKELADIMLFIIDPMSDIGPQLSLLNEIREKFNLKLLVLINKKDIAERERIDYIKNKIIEFQYIEISAKIPEDCNSVFETATKMIG